MWYVIQTMTGHEQELADLIMGRQASGRCFVMKREAVWRRQGECIKHVETLFPGYVFIDTDDPQRLYQEMKKIPRFAKLLGKGELNDSEELEFIAISEEEKKFLENLLDGDPEDTVRLSPVKIGKNSQITRCGGALRHYKDYIIKKRIRLRYVIVRLPFLGQDRDILLGIEVKGDYKTKDEAAGEGGARRCVERYVKDI